MSNGLHIVSQFDEHYNQAYRTWDPFFPKAERDLRFFLNDQWDESEKNKLFNDGRSTFVFNRIRPAINFITGFQRQRRTASVVTATQDRFVQTADQLTKCLFNVMNYNEGYRVISDCFSGAVKTGWNLMSVWMDYRDDPENGTIRFNRDPYNAFICDGYFSKLDFSDCGFIIRRKYLSPNHVMSLLPGHEDQIFELSKSGWARDDKFTWLPYQRQPSGQNMMAFDEYWVQEWRPAKAVVDVQTGDYRIWPGTDKALKEFVGAFPEVKIINTSKRFAVRHIIVNNHWIRTDENPDDLDEYPFVPFIAIWEPESDQWELKVQSLIRSAIDPQREANKRRSQMVDILDSQINSGWIAEEDSVVNPRSLFQSSQGKVIWKKHDATPGSLEKIPPAQIPPSFFQLQELFDKDIKDILGINDAAFGQMESANESGVMHLIRQGISIANMQEVFDNLRYAQKAITKKVIKLIQTWTPEKIEQMIGEKPTEDFYDPDLTKYDIVVEEAVETSTQKQLYFRQLLELKKLEVPITGEMLAKAAPIQNKAEFTQEIANLEKQQMQMAQEQKQVQERLLQSQENLNQARAISDIALSKERFTRAVANMGLEDERASASIENRSQATLNRMRAAKEISQMDDDRLMKFLDMFMKLEELNRAKEERLKVDDVSISAQASTASQPERTQAPAGMVQQEITSEV